MLLSEIAVVLKQETPAAEFEINWLLTDSRLLAFPSETLFFALLCKRFHFSVSSPFLKYNIY